MAELGNLGDHKSVGNGIAEMRIDHGPGYRIYYTIKNRTLLLLLLGGDKSTQAKDVVKARTLLSELEDFDG
jgi:putative addiction module killer protein